MKRKNGKKVRKIVLLVILAVVAGVVLYDLVFCWPVHPSLQKPAESYKQLSQTAKKLGVLAPPEDILPWKQEEYSIYLSSIRRFARPTGWDMAGKVIYDGTTYPVYILALRNTEKHEEYPPLRENYKHVPIYRECSEDGLRLFFVIDGHSYTYSMGMMAPPEETIPQDAVDFRRSPAGRLPRNYRPVFVTGKESCHEEIHKNRPAGGAAGSCGRHRVYRADLADISPTQEKRG